MEQGNVAGSSGLLVRLSSLRAKQQVSPTEVATRRMPFGAVSGHRIFMNALSNWSASEYTVDLKQVCLAKERESA